MATTITRALADTYFETRIDQSIWESFTTQMRDKAIVSSLDLLGRANGQALTVETADSDQAYYPDRATYHQALYMLVNSEAVADGELAAAKWPGTNSDREPNERRDPYRVCLEARKWLDWQSGPTVKIVKG